MEKLCMWWEEQCVSWELVLPVALESQTTQAEGLLHSLWETRRCVIEEDLSHLCVSWDGGLMAVDYLIFHSSILWCFPSHGMRENVKNWEDMKRKSLLPMQVLDLPLMITLIGLLFPRTKKYMQCKVFLLCQLAKTLGFLPILQLVYKECWVGNLVHPWRITWYAKIENICLRRCYSFNWGNSQMYFTVPCW